MWILNAITSECVFYTFSLTSIFYFLSGYVLVKTFTSKMGVRLATDMFLKYILPMVNKNTGSNGLELKKKRGAYHITFIEDSHEYQIYIPYDKYNITGINKCITLIHTDSRREQVNHPIGVPFLVSADHLGVDKIEVTDFDSGETSVYTKTDVPSL